MIISMAGNSPIRRTVCLFIRDMKRMTGYMKLPWLRSLKTKKHITDTIFT